MINLIDITLTFYITEPEEEIILWIDRLYISKQYSTKCFSKQQMITSF